MTVVSDGTRLLADVDRAGDEPLMLARQLPTVPVLVSADRYLAGLLAERRLGCTVHVLDDGFQHFRAGAGHRPRHRVAGRCGAAADAAGRRLREPLDVVRRASALIVAGADHAQASAIRRRRGRAGRVPAAPASSDRPRLVEPAGRVVSPAAGNASPGASRDWQGPGRFFADLAESGWTVASEMSFGDHHRYTAADLARIVAEMRAVRAVMVVTTEKDLVRLLPLRPLPVPVAWVPMQVTIEPAAEFERWLAGQLLTARRRQGREPQAAGRKPD